MDRGMQYHNMLLVARVGDPRIVFFLAGGAASLQI